MGEAVGVLVGVLVGASVLLPPPAHDSSQKPLQQIWLMVSGGMGHSLLVAHSGAIVGAAMVSLSSPESVDVVVLLPPAHDASQKPLQQTPSSAIGHSLLLVHSGAIVGAAAVLLSPSESVDVVVVLAPASPIVGAWVGRM